jgi:molecular chaperone GrpE
VQDPNPDAGETAESAPGVEECDESLEEWRDRALRLQAEMENFRKRQQRLAEERIAADRERLLRAFLGVADDLERALSADGTDTQSLRRGVDLTYQGLMRLMEREGAEPVRAEGQPFDPAFHEAVGTTPREQADVAPDVVVKVVQTGYQLDDRLLRPARVIVAT